MKVGLSYVLHLMENIPKQKREEEGENMEM